MTEKTFHVAVVTPERAVFEGEATFVALPSHDGEVGILPQRAPLLVKLDVGKLRIDGPEGRQLLFIDGGFAEVVDNHLTILTEEALEPAALDRDTAQTELAEAQAMSSRSESDFQRRQHALKRARVQLQLLS